MQDGHELTDDFREDAIEQAKEMGRRKAPGFICDYCAEIDLQPPEDERLKRIAGWRIDEDYKPFFRQPPEAPTDDHYWFYNEEVWPAFRKAYNDNCAEPEQCDVCLDDGMTCNHERHYPGGCPVDS